MAINDTSSLSPMAAFLDIIGERSSADFDNITDLANYLAEKLLAQGIGHPNDLGFLCSGQAGVPLSVQQALDPNMSEAAKLLLSQACAVQIPMIAGVIDAATLALHRQVVSGVSEPAKARHATGGLFLSLRRQETSPPASEPAKARSITTASRSAQPRASACPQATTLAGRDAQRMHSALDRAYELFRTYGTDTTRYHHLFTTGNPTPNVLAVLRRCLQAGTRSAPALRSRMLVAKKFLNWSRASSLALSAHTEWTVAGWVDTMGKASKQVVRTP